MSREEIAVEEYTCDGCGKTELVSRPDDAKGWYCGDAYGAESGEWDACSKKCIRAAVLKVVGESDG